MGKKSKKPRSIFSDPRRLNGAIVGPGGPHDKSGVVIDATNSVIVEACALARADEVSDGTGSEVIAMLLSGHVLHSEDRADVLFMLDVDGLATLLTEIYGLIGRMGNDALALKADIEQRMEKMQAEGLLDHHHHHHHHHKEDL